MNDNRNYTPAGQPVTQPLYNGQPVYTAPQNPAPVQNPTPAYTYPPQGGNGAPVYAQPVQQPVYYAPVQPPKWADPARLEQKELRRAASRLSFATMTSLPIQVLWTTLATLILTVCGVNFMGPNTIGDFPPTAYYLISSIASFLSIVLPFSFFLFFGKRKLSDTVLVEKNGVLNSVLLVFAGLAVSAVGLPIAGVVAVARAGGLDKLAGRVHPVFAMVFTILVYLSIGPCLAIPRTASTSFQMLVPLIGGGTGLQLAYSVLFFAAAFLVALRPEKLTDWLGRILCPCLIVLIVVLFAGCLIHPLAAHYGTPSAEYAALPAVQGILYGYQTMDTLAGLNFGAVIALNIRARGVTESHAVEGGTIRAGFIAGGLMLVVYAMLGHAGAETGTVYPGLATGAEVLTVLAERMFGKAGLVLLAAIFMLACFNTCVGLIACVGEYFHTLLSRIPYPALAAFFAAASMLIANLGLADILRLSVPVLNALYPVAIVLITLSFVPGLEQRRRVYPLCIGCTAVQSIAAALPLGPLSALANALPLAALGFGWVLPAVIGLLAGIFLSCTEE